MMKLRFLNPKNLAKEVSAYGYNFSWKSHLFLIISSLFGIAGIGILYKLDAVYFSIITIAVLGMLPVMILFMYQRMYEQKRFADAVTYGEQLLYSFQKEKKIISALKECGEIFEAGRMKKCIESAVSCLEAGKSDSGQGILREALQLIEKPYACGKLHMIHEFLIGCEEYGGNNEQSTYLLLNDLELWKRRGYLLQAEKKKSHGDNLISIAIATILCATALYVLDSMGKLYPAAKVTDIFRLGIIQMSSFVFILFMLYVLMKSFQMMKVNWLQGEEIQNEDYIISGYRKIIAEEEGKAGKQNFLTLIPHKIGLYLAKKDICRELYLTLPQWLMEIALLLQSNNVQVSIIKSKEMAPPLLKAELEQLTERLQEAPDKLSSYVGFCKNFDVPEVQSCMKMLHAISESGTGNAGLQIHNLIQRVNEMQAMADEIRNESIAFQAKMFFSYPVIAATAKLLLDLTVGMISMMQMLGSVGGMS